MSLGRLSGLALVAALATSCGDASDDSRSFAENAYEGSIDCDVLPATALYRSVDDKTAIFAVESTADGIGRRLKTCLTEGLNTKFAQQGCNIVVSIVDETVIARKNCR